MILTRVKPHIFLPGLGLVWGTFAALMGATQNWTQLAGMRFLLGVAEVRRAKRHFGSRSQLINLQAGFAPGCAFFLSSWYRKYELATRFALLYTSVPIAGAVSGLLAGLITDYMDGISGLAGWRWLFVSSETPHSEMHQADDCIPDHRRCCFCCGLDGHLLLPTRLPLDSQALLERGGKHFGMQQTGG